MDKKQRPSRLEKLLKNKSPLKILIIAREVLDRRYSKPLRDSKRNSSSFKYL